MNVFFVLKWYYGISVEDKGLMDVRVNVCEIVVWCFLIYLFEREVVDYCFYEILDFKDVESYSLIDEEEGEVDEYSVFLV